MNLGVVRLSRALYIPESVCSLISVGELSKKGCVGQVVPPTNNKPGKWRFIKDKVVVMQATQVGNHYVLDVPYPPEERSADESPTTECVLAASAKTTLYGWHCRFAHPGLAALKQIVQDLHLQVTATENEDREVRDCEHCKAAKMATAEFPKASARRAERPGVGIHIDLSSAKKEDKQLLVGVDGTLHVLAITDDFSRYLTIFCLKRKSEAAWLPRLKEYVQFYKERGQKLEWIRADNAFKTNGVIEWCNKEGIIPEFTVPYSPQQNGVVESRLASDVQEGPSRP